MRAHLTNCILPCVEDSWRPLGASETLLGLLGGLSCPLGSLLGASWGPLGALLGASWGLLGASWGLLGASWGPSWEPLGGLWALFKALWSSWNSLGEEKQRKNTSEVWVWRPKGLPKGTQNRPPRHQKTHSECIPISSARYVHFFIALG